MTNGGSGINGRIKKSSLRVAQNPENNPGADLTLASERDGDRLQKFIPQMRSDRPRGGGGKHRLYGIDISLMNLRHHWNACSRTSAAGVSDLPSVIQSSADCAV
jgi:hypothetical protein